MSQCMGLVGNGGSEDVPAQYRQLEDRVAVRKSSQAHWRARRLGARCESLTFGGVDLWRVRRRVVDVEGFRWLVGASGVALIRFRSCKHRLLGTRKVW
jgi:hypothetical protein